MVFAAVGTGTI